MPLFRTEPIVPAMERPDVSSIPQIIANDPSASPARSRTKSTFEGNSELAPNSDIMYHELDHDNPGFNYAWPRSSLMYDHEARPSFDATFSQHHNHRTIFNHDSTVQKPSGTGSLRFAANGTLSQERPLSSSFLGVVGATSEVSKAPYLPGANGNGISNHGLHSRFGDNTLSTDSDGYAHIGHDCVPCQYNGHKLRELEVRNQSLESQNQDLLQRLHWYEKVVTSQHLLVKSQQALIDKEVSENRQIQQLTIIDQSKKRKSSPVQERHSKLIPLRGQDTLTVAGSSKRAKFPPQQRQQTAETRTKGACVRCWKHKQRCEPGREIEGPCKSCSEPSLSMIRIPCIRTHIVDISLFRLGTGHNDTWVTRDEVYSQKDLSTYFPENRKTLLLTHGFGAMLKVYVKRYLPIRDEVTEYVWWDLYGNEHSKQTPHYAICDLESLKPAINSYIVDNQDTYIREYISHEHGVIYMAFEIARKYAKENKSSLLASALRLWMAGRLIEKQWQICGKEKLGLQSDNHWKFVPITPIMDTQLDQVVIRSFLQPMRESLLRQLQTKIEKECRKSSFEIFICIIILLSTLEEAIRHDHEFAAFYGHVYSPGRKRFEDYKLVESYFHAAITLVAHVKMALEGKFPHLDADIDVSKLLGTSQDHDEQNFMIKVDKYLHTGDRANNFTRLRECHEYESNQFWVHQLFLKSWNGMPIHIQEKQLQ